MTALEKSELCRLRDQAMAFSHACIKTRIGHLGTDKSKIIFEIRDSLIYRAWFVQWHVDYLQRQHRAFEKELQGQILEVLNSPQLLFTHRSVLSFIFDDIVFNSASMFDYIGNLVGLAYLGPNKTRLKWNGALNSSRDKSNPIYGAPVAEKLLIAHKEWVDHLMNYRGDTIHHKIDLGTAGHKFEISKEKLDVKLNAHIPCSLAKSIFQNKSDLSLVDGSKLLAESSAKYCNGILACMETTMDHDYW